MNSFKPNLLSGVRTFCPMPVAKMLQNVGGTKTLLGLVAMATDVEGLYAAVKSLVCVVKSNKQAQHDLDRVGGYQVVYSLHRTLLVGQFKEVEWKWMQNGSILPLYLIALTIFSLSNVDYLPLY